jgi:hypothetical protein
MKNIFKIIAVSFIMLVGIGTVNAQGLKQESDKPEVIAKQKTAQISKALDLSGDQQRTVFRALVINESNTKKHITGKDANDPTVKTLKKKYAATLEESIKKVLTPEQMKKWKTMNN